MHTLYNILLVPARWLAALSALRYRNDPERAEEWSQRRARSVPSMEPGGLWIHGASVGEARIAGSLGAELRGRRPELPLAVSAYTRTGRATLPSPPEVDQAFYIPLDMPGYARRVLDRLAPAGLVLVETELWPNLIREAVAREVPVTVVNGRLSPGRMKRYRRLASLYRPLLRSLAALGIQSEGDARRFLELGVEPDRIRVTGNIKYDLPRPRIDPAGLQRRFGLAPGRPVLVAGSTGHGEDEPVLDAFLRVRRRQPDAWLVLAPRHPERSDRVYGLARQAGLRLGRISSGDSRAGSLDGLLVDTLGELSSLYCLATAAFVGGSLVPVGGHNVLEPAAAGVPVLFGPHHEHFREPARALVEAGGGRLVATASALADAWLESIADPAAARAAGRAAEQVVESNRGALNRSVDLILRTLSPGGSR